MSDTNPDIDLFRSLEQALHRQDVRGSRAAVEALLSEDFVEFGSSGGIYDRASVVDALAQETSAPNSPSPDMRDFTARALAPDSVLVTYRSVDPERQVLRSSIWKHAGGTWRMMFHQGTIVPPAS